MRNQLCRVTLLGPADLPTGRGFIVDSLHIVTCLHVVRYCDPAQREPRPGAEVRVRTDGGQVIACRVKAAGGAPDWRDICCLESIDGAVFSQESWAQWGPAGPGQSFSGLGASARVSSGVAIYGEIVAIGEGGGTLIVTAGSLDTRIEPGCSGAAVFALDDGPLLGMVATYQQSQSGTLIAGRTIAEFCASLSIAFAKAMPPATLGAGDAFAPLTRPVAVPGTTADAPPLPPLASALASLDRKPQKTKLGFAIQTNDLLDRGGGIVISLLGGVETDMPHLCAHTLVQLAFERIVKRMAPQAAKPLNPIVGRMADLLDESIAVSVFNLQSLVAEKLGVAGARIAELRRAVAEMGAPIGLVVEARPRDLEKLSAAVLLGWATLLEDLARPRKNQPIALFILNVAPEETPEALAVPPALAINAPYFVPLDVLPLIGFDDIATWGRNQFGIDPASERLREQINAVILARAGGREQFRFGEIYKWLTQGQAQ